MPHSKIYLRCFNSDFDAVKSKVGLVNEYIRTRHSLPLNSVSVSALVSAPPFIYLQSFKLDFNDSKHKVGLLKKKIKSSYLCGTKLDFFTINK